MTAPEPKEREVKLELPAAALAKFRRAIKETPKSQSQVSVYFDTDKEKLRKRGVMLRVRRSGRHFVQTIKALAEANIFVRDEWQSEIDGDEPDLRLARDTALGPLLGRKLRRRLKPRFETRVRRTVYPLSGDDCEIELTLDHGTIDTGEASQPLCEFELALKDGNMTGLFEAARNITRTLPVQLGLQSKAERGYLLLNGKTGAPVSFAAAPLDKGLRACDAFRRIGRACLYQIAGNEEALCKGDPEGVHQMRVGLRRLRAAMSLF
jgi:triphosphatase